jgi:pimeloyl-ACP methyl ester carboxylesterase
MVLAVTGAEDHLSTLATNRAVAALLQDGEVVRIDDAGHLLPFEQPLKVVDAVRSWLVRKGLFA